MSNPEYVQPENREEFLSPLVVSFLNPELLVYLSVALDLDIPPHQVTFEAIEFAMADVSEATTT